MLLLSFDSMFFDYYFFFNLKYSSAFMHFLKHHRVSILKAGSLFRILFGKERGQGAA